MPNDAIRGTQDLHPDAFGFGQDEHTFGPGIHIPNAPPIPTSRLGDPGDDAEGTTTTDNTSQQLTDIVLDVGTGKFNPPFLALAAGAFAVAVGGALVGYLATGGRGWEGPVIGATTNSTLYFAGTAVAGRNRFSSHVLWGLILGAVACAGGAGFLYWKQRKAR